MTRNRGDELETPVALSRSQRRSEPPNPVLGGTGSQAVPAERLTARQMGIGPVKDVPRGIGSTWTLDVPRRVGCTCPRCAPDPIPAEGWVGY
jgi:hypothetical protein